MPSHLSKTKKQANKQKLSHRSYRTRRPWMTKIILNKQTNNTGGTAIPDVKIYLFHSHKNNIVLAQKNSYEDKRNKTEEPNMNTHNFSHFIIDKDAKNKLSERKHLQQMELQKK